MLTLTEPQVWVLIGAFIAIMGAMVGLVLRVTGKQTDVLQAEIGGLRGELRSRDRETSEVAPRRGFWCHF